MACCSGPTQTRRLTVLIDFRPIPTKQFRLKIELQGRNGSWQGRNSGTYDFGSIAHCDGQQPLGVQDVAMKMKLSCLEGVTISGSIDITFLKSIQRFTLPSIPINCIDGGPKSQFEWPYLFLNGYLGNATISVSGKGL